MDYYFMTDKAISKDIGLNAKRMRLNKNYSQQEVACQAGISVNAVKSVEQGRGTLLSYIKYLRVLGRLGDLECFLYDPGFSPIQVAKLRGKVRVRATGTRSKK